MRLGFYSLLILVLASAAHAQSDIPLEDASPHAQAASGAEPDLTALQDLFANGTPSLLRSDSFASRYSLPGNVLSDTKPKFPTKLDYADGPMRWNLESSVTTRTAATTTVPAMADPYGMANPTGGTGNLKSKVTYDADQWEFYGSRNIGVTQSDGTPAALQDSTTVGSLYKLPDWMNGGKVGTSVEFLANQERKTRVEYRRSFGPAEGYVSAEQLFAPHQTDVKTAPTTVRGGLSRKF